MLAEVSLTVWTTFSSQENENFFSMPSESFLIYYACFFMLQYARGVHQVHCYSADYQVWQVEVRAREDQRDIIMHQKSEHVNLFLTLSFKLLCKLWLSQVFTCRTKDQIEKAEAWKQ